MELIHDFKGVKNVAHYSAYDDEFSKKPTTFYSNITIPLKTTKEKAKVIMIPENGDKRKSLSRSYNERSDIPLNLVKEILGICSSKISNNKESYDIYGT